VRIAIVNNWVPFLTGGAEHLAQALTSKLIEHGHEAILVRIPFRWEPPSKIVESMLACRLLEFANIDRLITLKFPVYCIPHPHKIVWLLHQFRQAYDLWGTALQGLPDSPQGIQIRDAIRAADDRCLREARRIFTNSHITAERLKTFNDFKSEVLFPPLLETHHFNCVAFEDFIFYPSRVNSAKRQWLAVESMHYVTTPVKLLLAGKAEGGEAERITRVIKEHSLADRVQWLNEFIPEQAKAEYLSRALGTCYIPYDEDSYGYVTLESYSARKPVISCIDSGGTDVLVKDQITGLVVPPDARAIAEAMDRLYLDKQAARAMGEAGHNLVQDLGINWERVVEALTQ